MPKAGHALIVDDDEALRMIAAKTLARDGWAVEQAALGAEVPQRARNTQFDLILLDQRLPDADGVDLLEQLREDGYAGAAIVVTGYPTVQKAALALGSAATDYLCKPLEPAQLLAISRQARAGAEADHKWEFLWNTIQKRHGFSNVLSADSATRQCYITAARVADSPASIVIEGETGTGKEYLARAVHYMSSRRDGPFVAVNCAAIPDTLVESELFGHEKGAFTSAASAKKGICEMADGGTLLLDEVGELTPAAQVKLLRFLQDHTITRLGGLKPVELDVRIIAATNSDLLAAVTEGRFREDLYYRIAVVPLTLPPLRERPRDIPLFAEHFLRDTRREMSRGPSEFDPQAMQVLAAHTWPGNLRELRNVVQRSALLAHSPVVRAHHIQVMPSEDAPNPSAAAATRPISLADAEREHIKRVLAYTANNKSEASRILGIARKTLRAKIASHGIGEE